MTTGKTIALIRRTLVGKVMSLLLNMLSWLIITFLPRSKRLLISWLQSPSAVTLEPKKIKSDTVSTVSLSISHEVILLLLLGPYHFCPLLGPSLYEIFPWYLYFLEKISSLSHSIVFLYFFVLVTEEVFLIYHSILWNSTFKCVYLSFSPLLFTSLLFTAICKASSDSHFAFLHFFSMG